MGITQSEMSEFMARFGNKRIEEQVNMAAPLLGFLDEVKVDGAVDIINIKGGEIDAVTFIADSGTLPTGSSKEPVQAVVNPKFLFGRLTIPRGSATLANGKRDGINMVLQQVDTLSANLGRVLDRALIKSTLATLTTAQATELDAIAPGGSGSGTLTMTDPFGLRVGSIIERRTSGGTYKELMRVTKIVYDTDGTSHTVTLTRDINAESGLTTGDPAPGDILYLRGAQANGMTSLDQCADETTDVYGHDADTNDWIGNTEDQGGALDVQGMRDLWSQTCIRGGSQPDFVLTNSKVRQLYSDTLLDQRRYHSGKMDATGGMEVDFEGKPVKIDESCPFDSLYYVKKKDFKVACWKKFSDDSDGGVKAPSDRGHLLLGLSTFDYDAQRWGAYNAHCPRRANLASLTGITG